MPSLDETKALVRKLFDGVTDLGGMPFADHCIRVMDRLPADATDDEKHAALLHDVIEDTAWDAADLRAIGYSAKTIGIVEEVTLRETPPYSEQIKRLARYGSRSAIRVKLADNADNLDPERLARTGDQRDRLEQKYQRARETLSDALASRGPE